MKLNRAELRKVMYDFNSVANRLMKAEFDDYNDVLKKFLTFISDCPVISAYLDDCGSTIIADLDVEIKEVANSYGRMIFLTGETPSEENANILAILRHMSEKNYSFQGVSMGYSHGKTYNDKIKGFNERFVLVMIRNIEGYLTKMGIDMGLDESVKYNITVHNGQVNLASDNAVINATINNGINQAELQSLLDKVIATSNADLTNEEKITISESVEVIHSELKQDKPKKTVLRGILTTLQAIKGTAEFSAAVVALVQFVQPFIS